MFPPPNTDLDCLIVGAGISGLLAAATLKDQGFQVCVLEKSRGFGGRMATRRIDGAVFDHGAQFLTVRDARFKKWVDNWAKKGFVVPWYSLENGEPHYCALPGMTSIAKCVAGDYSLDVRLSEHVNSAHHVDGKWRIELASGGSMTARSLILTAPVPQSLDLLQTGNVELSSAGQQWLQSIKFHKCIAAMAVLEQQSLLDQHNGALKLRTQPIQWIADNQRKGISSVPSVTIHSTPEFAEEHWDTEDSVRLPKLLAAAEPYLGSKVITCQGHRWKFSQPVIGYKEKCYFDQDKSLAIAGDGLAGGRVEGAAVSGLSAADKIIQSLRSETILPSS